MKKIIFDPLGLRIKMNTASITHKYEHYNWIKNKNKQFKF